MCYFKNNNFNLLRLSLSVSGKDSSAIPDIPLTSFNNLWFLAPRSCIADFIPHFQHEFNNPIIVGLIIFHRFHNTIPIDPANYL
ncbi:unnamed protein product, partial [Vitis vinifera]